MNYMSKDVFKDVKDTLVLEKSRLSPAGLRSLELMREFADSGEDVAEITLDDFQGKLKMSDGKKWTARAEGLMRSRIMLSEFGNGKLYEVAVIGNRLFVGRKGMLRETRKDYRYTI